LLLEGFPDLAVNYYERKCSENIGGLWLRREYPCWPVVGVGAIIVDRGRLVLVMRGAEPALGKWSFPGSSGAGGDC